MSLTPVVTIGKAVPSSSLTSCALPDLDHLTTSLLKTMTLDANPIEGPFFSLFQWRALELNTALCIKDFNGTKMKIKRRNCRMNYFALQYLAGSRK